MFKDSLAGLRVLVASDDHEIAALFVTIVAVCGAEPERSASASATIQALERHPHVVLLDVAMPGGADLVPFEADQQKIPVSTDVYQVCGTLQRAVAEAA